MTQSGALSLSPYMCKIVVLWILLLTVCIVPGRAQTQADSLYYSRKNSFGVFAAYSNDSSHMLMGDVGQRKLLELGGTYSRRLFQNQFFSLQYEAELLPVSLESDPVIHQTTQQILPVAYPALSYTFEPYGVCQAGSSTISYTVNGVVHVDKFTETCSRRWTIGEGISPVGVRWNFLPRRRWQPVIEGHGGYMYSTQPIPVDQAGNFNFTFDVGAGVEFFRSKSTKGTRSVRAEYRYHHISNDDTASQNPGIDNGVIQLTYVFGR